MNPNSGYSLSANTPTAGSVYDSSNRMNINGAAYNAGGNQYQIGGFGFVYDGENRLWTSTLSGATLTYGYDGESRRVTKQSGGTTTIYVYDATGNLAQEYVSGTIPPAPPCSPCFLMADHLGSTRLMTDASGVVKEKHDYLPFGGGDGVRGGWAGFELGRVGAPAEIYRQGKRCGVGAGLFRGAILRQPTGSVY